MTPVVVISLDFELRWGVADRLPDSPDAYRRNLLGAKDAVWRMLELFQERNIGVTWATVGAVACSGWDEYHERAPNRPAYQNQTIGFRKAWQQLDPKGELHFAPELVDAIAKACGQELGSHTFSHIYFREVGCEPADVLADSIAVRKIFEDRTGHVPTSFVFPRNQVGHSSLLQQAGIQRWRRNPRVFFWNATRSDEQSKLVRGLRMVDAVIPIGERRAAAKEMRASYLVRFPLPDWAWQLHVKRIIREAGALQPGEALHLWWHPHNLGAAIEVGLNRLSNLLDRIQEAVPVGTRFATMEQSAQRA